MQADQAEFLRDLLLTAGEDEAKTTRRVLAASPAEQGGYAPHPASTPALDLAWHIASSQVWFYNGVAAGSFPAGEGTRPAEIQTPADVVAWYDSNRPPAVEKVKALSGEQLARTINFYGVLQLPAAMYLTLEMNHTIHHRGQLSAYLRPMGAKVPSIYGGSADEPFEAPPAEAAAKA